MRQLAEDIGVNMMTVSKAYTILKQEGFIVIDRRHGATVAPSMDDMEVLRQRLKGGRALWVAEAQAKGMHEETFYEICRDMFMEMKHSGKRGQ